MQSMEREYYLMLARSGLRMPIGADLVVREQDDPDAVLTDGARLGRALEETARRFRTPLAVPHMDLELEKKALLRAMGVPETEASTFHFDRCPDEKLLAKVEEGLQEAPGARLQAASDAIRYIARHTNLLPIGMCIGPFSLMTKLLADPIAPVFLAGMGVSAEEDDEVRRLERVLELGMRVIERAIAVQVEAGARMIFVAEPAANTVYLSPKQMAAGSDAFDRYVMGYNRRLKALLDWHGVDLLFHCCGELTDAMVAQFASLDPAILSLGSSRRLWEDAAFVPKNVVLFGNLPSKQFYSDALITQEDVVAQAAELTARMRQAGHPFILGTECDVLSVPDCHVTIMGKVMALIEGAAT
jgi:uroporphyrinogen-III decarboxylase